jgi:Ca2+-binding EF-hand superfamily protein
MVTAKCSLQINEVSLADGLAKLGFAVSDSDVSRLLEQLSTVPGLEDTGAVVSRESFAASQLDWEALQAAGGDEWEQLARAAFDALDLDGDGLLQRGEMEIMLIGRCAMDARRPS